MGLVVGVILNAIKEELAGKGVTLKDLRDLLKKSKGQATVRQVHAEPSHQTNIRPGLF
ncbi:MAG: hypothetical protein WCB62_28025 [Pseudolabrys sp.]